MSSTTRSPKRMRHTGQSPTVRVLAQPRVSAAPDRPERERSRRSPRVALLAIALSQAACGGADSGESPEPTARPATRSAPRAPTSPPLRTDDMQISLVLDDTELTATLVDNATTRDLLAMLPLRLTLSDFSATEKISDLPRRLSTAGAPAGVDPEVGDITYYAPWGNLAIFYRDFGYSTGLIKLGHIDSDIETLARISGDATVTLQRATAVDTRSRLNQTTDTR